MSILRRLLQFRLLTLLLVIMICCIGLGYLVQQYERHRQEMAAVDAVNVAGGLVEIETSERGRFLRWVGVDYERTFDRVIKVDLTRMRSDPETSLLPPAPLPSLLEQVSITRQAQSIDDKRLASLARLVDLQSLNLYGSTISDSALRHLASLRQLKALSLPTTTTDEGLRSIRPLKNLRYLGLSGTKITDEGCRQIVELQKSQVSQSQ